MKKELRNNSGFMYYTLEYKPEQELIISAWYGEDLSLKEIQEACTLALDLIQAHQIPLILNDNSQLTGTWDNANDWINDYWMPEAIKGGLKRFAHVLSPEFYAQLSAELMEDDNQSIAADFELVIFEEVQEAENWLLSYQGKAAEKLS